MLADDNRAVRAEAVKKILKARKKERRAPERQSVRKFVRPMRHMINENAAFYHEILNWDQVKGNKFNINMI